MFEEIKKNFGFGLMRLPMINEDVDYEQIKGIFMPDKMFQAD